MTKTTWMTKQEWNALRYPISLRELSEEEGGGWLATIPLLGEGAFMADGDTTADAIASLEDLRRSLYDALMNSGKSIPVPTDVTEEVKTPSGKWMMRASSRLHTELQEGARASGISFNAYCVQCLERGNAVASVAVATRSELEKICSEFRGVMRHTARTAVEEAQVRWAVHSDNRQLFLLMRRMIEVFLILTRYR